MLAQVIVVCKGSCVVIREGMDGSPLLFMLGKGSFQLLQMGFLIRILHEHGVFRTSWGKLDRMFPLWIAEDEHTGRNGVLLQVEQTSQSLEVLYYIADVT